MSEKLTIIEALKDPHLLGGLPAFRDLSTWTAWLVFLKAVYGLPLDEEEEAIFRERTGRMIYDPPPGGWQEVAAIVGRAVHEQRFSLEEAVAAAMAPPPAG